MRQDEHSHGEVRRSSAVPGYQPAQSVTRYEAAATLFEMLTHIEAAVAQPRRSKYEVKPGRLRNLPPNPSKAKRYTDVPASHWASKSVVGLSSRSVSLVEGASFKGDQSITGDELAQWADGVSGWVEGRPSVVKSVAELVKQGYLPQTTPLLKKSGGSVTAHEATILVEAMILRSLEKITTISPDSRYAK